MLRIEAGAEALAYLSCHGLSRLEEGVQLGATLLERLACLRLVACSIDAVEIPVEVESSGLYLPDATLKRRLRPLVIRGLLGLVLLLVYLRPVDPLLVRRCTSRASG